MWPVKAHLQRDLVIVLDGLVHLLAVDEAVLEGGGLAEHHLVGLYARAGRELPVTNCPAL